MFYWQEFPSKIQHGRTSGQWLKGNDYCCQRPHGCYQCWYLYFTRKCQQATNTVGYRGDLEEPPDSCEQTRAPVLWLSCECQTDVWELFTDSSCLSAILDRQAFMVAAPVVLRTKKAESFSPQAWQGFWSRIKIDQKEVTWQQYHLCLTIAEYQILGGKQFVVLGPTSGKIGWLQNVQYLQEKYHCQWTLFRGRQPKWIFHNLSNLLRPL